MFVPPAIAVAFYDGDPLQGGTLLGKTVTTTRLAPGQFDDVSISLSRTSISDVWVVADDDGTGTGQVREPDEANNTHHAALSYLLPQVTVASPANGSAIAAGTTVLISGHAATLPPDLGGIPASLPNRIGAVLINGTAADVVDAAGNFFARVSVLPGLNTFDITALDAYGQSAGTTLTLDGTQQPGGSAQLLFDVSPSFAAEYARTSFDQQKQLLYAELAIRNQGEYDADNPFYVAVRNISHPTVTVRDSAGVTPDGIPYYNFSPAVPGDSLAPAEITGHVNAVFHNPNQIPFQYELVFLAKLNEPPVFTSTPVVETTAGRPYTYDVDATDLDGDTLTYSLISGPQNLHIDPATGAITWLPALGDLGVHSITLRVADPRGGSAEQRFLLAVTEAPSNRPPMITSLPVTDAIVGESYSYDVDATDPDFDPVSYSLVHGPNDMQVNSQTGLGTWTPGSGAIQKTISFDQPNVTPGFGPDWLDGRTPKGMELTDQYEDVGVVFSLKGNGAAYFSSVAFVGGETTVGNLIAVNSRDRASPVTLCAQFVAPETHVQSTIDASTFRVFLSDTNTSPSPRVLVRSFGSDGTLLEEKGLTTLGGFVQFSTGRIARVEIYDNGGDGYTLDDFSFATDISSPVTVTVQASDGRGGVDTQSFVVRVQPQPGNHPPVIVSEPVTTVAASSGPTLGRIVVAADEWATADKSTEYPEMTPQDPPNDPTHFALNVAAWFVEQSGKPTGRFLAYSTNRAFTGAKLAQTMSAAGHAWTVGVSNFTFDLVHLQAYDAVFLAGNLADNQVLIDYVEGGGNVYLAAATGAPGSSQVEAAGWRVFLNHFGFDLANLYDDAKFGIPVHGNMAIDNTHNIFAGVDHLAYGNGQEVLLSQSALNPYAKIIVDRVPVGTNGEPQGMFGVFDPPSPRYQYDVDAIDPDQDTLTYALAAHPDEMSINAQTGVIEWTPSGALLTRAQVTFSDADFNLSNWQSTTFTMGPGGTSTAEQAVSGGNPGSYLRIAAQRNGSSSSLSAIARFLQRSDAVYDPRTTGGILSLDFSMDEILLSSHGEPLPPGAALALEQNGIIYVAPDTSTSDVPTQWRHVEHNGLTESDFVRVVYSGAFTRVDANQHPDFSRSGDPVALGLMYELYSVPPAGDSDAAVGVDNWFVALRPALTFGVSVEVNDGRGGFSKQDYELTVARASDVQGFVFQDLNRNREWDRLPDLIVEGVAAQHFQYTTASAQLSQEFQVRSTIMTLGPDGDLYSIVGNSILRTDSRTGQAIGTFATFPGSWLPSSVSFSPAGDLYVVDKSSRGVVRFDGKTGEYLGFFVPAGTLSNPWPSTFGSDGNLWIGEVYQRQVYRFDGTDGHALGSFGVSDLVSSIAVGPDGDLFVGVWNANRIVRLDGRTGANKGDFVSSGSGGLSFVYGFVFSPDGYLYVCSRGNGRVLRYDGTNGTFVDVFLQWETGQYPVLVTLTPGSDAAPEPGLPGWTVYLDLNRNSRRDQDEPWTVTDQYGHYTFSNLNPGTYVVMEELKPGWLQAAPPDHRQVITVGQGTTVYNVNFGNYEGNPTNENLPPKITTTPESTIDVGNLYGYPAVSVDPNNDPLTFDLPLAPDGMTVHPERGIVVWQPTREQTGTHQVVLRVQDGQGGVDIQSFTITVVPPNSPPVITSTPPSPAVANLPYVYQVSAQDADAGDVLTFRLQDPLAGMVIDSDTGRFTWIPTADQIGSQAVTIVASDGHPDGETSQAFALEVAATAPNDPPVITSTPRERARVGQPYVYLVAASDPNGDRLSYHLDTAPADMAIDAATGVVTWTPANQLLGTSRVVTVRVQDGRGGVAMQEFFLQVVSQDINSVPAVVSTPPLTGIVGRTYTYNAVAADPEGDPVVWSLGAAPASMSIDPLRGTIRWTPAADQTGPQAVVVRVQDVFFAAATQSFAINVRAVNSPPAITSSPIVQANPGELYVYAPRASDPDGDPLRFRLSAKPDGMTIDETTGLVRWTPSPTQNGTYAVRIVVEDGQGGIDSQSYALSIRQQPANRPPLITSTPVYNAGLGRPYQYTVTAIDAEGDPITFQLDAGPTGLTMDPQGRITWATTSADAGTHTIEFTAGDSYGATDTASCTLTVTADTQAPTIELQIIEDGNFLRLPDAEGNIVVQIGAELLYQVRASDNVAVVSRTLTFNGEAVALDSQGRFTRIMDAVNAYEVMATAADAAGNTSDVSQRIMVYDPNAVGGPVIQFARLEQSPNKPAEQRTIWERQPDGLWKMKVPGQPDQLVNVPSITYLADLVGSISVESPSGTPAPLRYYQVDYAPMDTITGLAVPAERNDPRFQLIFRQEKPVDGELAPRLDESLLSDGSGLHPLDPTLIANGAYLLRVLASDVNGHVRSEGIAIGIDGSAKLGNFQLDFTDLQLPLAGIPITITRSYDTLDSQTEADFGYGWSLGIQDGKIRETVPEGQSFQVGTRVYVTNPEGKRVGFTFDPIQQGSWFGVIWTPRFKSDPGVSDKLEVYETQAGPPGTIFSTLGGPYNPSRYKLTTKDGAVYEYDQAAGLQKITDLNGTNVTFTETAITHSTAGAVQINRDPRGRIKQIVAPDGTNVKYTYNAAGDLVSFTNQAGEVTSYGYLLNDPKHPHFLDTITDSRGVKIFDAEFDDEGRLSSSTDALGNSVKQKFDTAAFEGTIWDARDNVTYLKYDERGNVLEKWEPKSDIGHEPNPVNPGDWLITKYEYNDRYPVTGAIRNPDLETKITDRNGVVEEREYDSAGNMTVVKRAAGTPQQTTTTYVYNARGDVTSIRQNGQPPTVFAYDSAGKLREIINAACTAASATYDGLGRQTSFTDFNGNATAYDYTDGCPCGSPKTITYADGTYEQFAYNTYGQVTQHDVFEADATLVETSSTRYDRLGRVIQETQGSGASKTVVQKHYDGNLLDWEIIVNPASPNETPATPIALRQSRITDYAYDAAGKLITQTDAEGGVVEFRYDANGNRVLLQDPVGNITTWVYDSVNRMVEERDPFYWVDYVTAHPSSFAGLTGDAFLSQIVTANDLPSGASAALNQGAEHVRVYAYDGEGNQTKIIDRDARRREFTYDPLNRLTEERWYDPDATLVRTIVSTYDAVGNLKTITDPDSSYTYTYDVLNRVTSVDNAGTPDMPHVVLSYQYDAMGNVLRTSDNLGVSVVSTYDDRNRLASRWWEGHSVDAARVDFLYTAAGREARIDRYSDLAGTTRVAYTDRTYDTAGRSKVISHERAVDDVIARYDYAYDFAGLLEHEDRSGESYPKNDWHADYTYDRTGQLLGADYSGADVIPEQVDEYYRYDANGNRTESYLHGTGYRTGNANQLLTDGTYNYAYDGEGNMVRKTEIATGQVTTFEYDHRNRMYRATIWSSDPASGGVVLHEEQYRYDVMNRRTSIMVDSDGAGSELAEVTRIIYNGDNAWADFGASGSENTQYLFGSGIDQIICQFRPPEGIGWYQPSLLHTTRGLINSLGQLVSRPRKR